jgi:hypothetical protein
MVSERASGVAHICQLHGKSECVGMLVINRILFSWSTVCGVLKHGTNVHMAKMRTVLGLCTEVHREARECLGLKMVNGVTGDRQDNSKLIGSGLRTRCGGSVGGYRGAGWGAQDSNADDLKWQEACVIGGKDGVMYESV